jgi:ribosomal protein S18 acetylase RimI-like enzyme
MAEIAERSFPTEYRLHSLFDAKKVKAFLADSEPCGVNLSSHYAHPSLWPASTFLILASKDNELSGVTFFHSHGLVLCSGEAIPGRTDLDAKLLSVTGHFTSRFHTMIGRPQDLDKIKTLFPGMEYRDVDYLFMSQEQGLFHERQTEIICRPARITDFMQLVELQCEYEIEEVILNPSRFSRAVCEQSVRSALAKQVIFVAEYRGQLIAKAQTNAIGYRYCQLGGIYTKKSFRKLGTGTAVVQALCAAIHAKGKKTCLFVKPANEAAINLYKKLGFLEIGPYRISYDKTKI